MNPYLWVAVAVGVVGSAVLVAVAWADREAIRQWEQDRQRWRSRRPHWDWDEITETPGHPLIFARVLDHDKEPPAGVYDFYQDGYIGS